MPLQSLPPAARRYGREQRAEIGAAVAAVGRVWRGGMGEDFDASFQAVGPRLLAVTDMAQERVAAGASRFIPEVLEETGQRAALSQGFRPDVGALVGTSGNGRSTAGLLGMGVIQSKQAMSAGATTAEALNRGGLFLSTAVTTLLADTGRAAERLESMSRPVTGWVRMVDAGACGRCVILAGKRERTSTAFERHPGCLCAAIPASESIAGDWSVDAEAYFESLDEAGQVRMMGSKANAEAVREYGADINQIVNSYSGGMQTAQVYGQNVKYTTAGTTRKGWANWRMQESRVAGMPRLMPETIARIAKDKADQARLLYTYGWVL